MNRYHEYEMIGGPYDGTNRKGHVCLTGVWIHNKDHTKAYRYKRVGVTMVYEREATESEHSKLVKPLLK